MNIFVLDLDPVLAAKAHCDKHVVKMCTEYAQLLSTAARLMDFPHEGYRDTHVRHPCTQWAAKHVLHWSWLYRLAQALGEEYAARYHRTHASTEALRLLPRALVTAATQYYRLVPREWAIVVPEDCLIEGNPVKSYRACYLKHKAAFAEWRHGETPSWWKKDRAQGYKQLSLYVE